MKANAWVKSSRCKADQPQCVEVFADGVTGQVHVRSTTAPGTLAGFTREEWSAFVEGVKAGEFDL